MPDNYKLNNWVNWSWLKQISGNDCELLKPNPIQKRLSYIQLYIYMYSIHLLSYFRNATPKNGLPFKQTSPEVQTKTWFICWMGLVALQVFTKMLLVHSPAYSAQQSFQQFPARGDVWHQPYVRKNSRKILRYRHLCFEHWIKGQLENLLNMMKTDDGHLQGKFLFGNLETSACFVLKWSTPQWTKIIESLF